ncbi:protein PTST, chloroplastic [Euphorbia lathyris]|uniref:protein PTST, chloroplastic n=1 Tax=Euphorbia lathyris TaxID=212925 RepID=UPI0033132229
MEIGTTGCCVGRQTPWFSWSSRTSNWRIVHRLSDKIKTSNPRLSYPYQVTVTKHWRSQESRRTYTKIVGLEESSSIQPEDEDNASDATHEEFPQPLNSGELKVLLADSERGRLIKKLSEANQHNRILRRLLHAKDDALTNFKSELGVMELEIQALVSLAEEIAQSGITQGSRKIHGKYIQSHLLSRLEAVHENLMEQIKDVDAVQSKEVHLFWVGMAESVQVMGSFDGWSQGEDLSPEYDGSFTKFTTTLMLRPGRYEIKFLVDGEWRLSPEYPSVGEGLTENNLLFVE